MSLTQATPMRNVPGAFLNTPAIARQASQDQIDPVRRRLFTDTPSTANAGVVSNATTASVPRPAALPPPNQPSPIQKAARAINSVLLTDESFPEIDSYLRQGCSSEYEVVPSDSHMSPFQKTHMHAIPDTIFNNINASEMQTLMGLFAEINHAWVAIDNSLFLWDYTQPNPELIGFEDQGNQITAVELVAPKPGIFVKDITHILVVATTAEIILLGVAAKTMPSGSRSVSLYQTKMSLSLPRGSGVTIVVGSANGRIFFGGTTSNHVFELYYQQTEKWFSGRCGKINHSNTGWTAPLVTVKDSLMTHLTLDHLLQMVIDDSRDLLYTLSSKGTIRTYHMEPPNRLTKVIEKDKQSCLREISHMISGFSPLLGSGMEIISISPISSRESARLHLQALTNTGCRLMLSATNSTSFLLGATTGAAPQSMQTHYVKFPPSDKRTHQHSLSSNDIVDQSSQALQTSRRGARFAPGYFLDFVRKQSLPNVDQLFLSAPDTGRINATVPASTLKYYESATWIEIGSLAEDVGLVTKPFVAAKQPMGFGNELAVQFDEPPCEFAILTNNGVHVIRRRRLVDIFASALSTGANAEMEERTRKFIQTYGRVETVATALAVACGHGTVGPISVGGTAPAARVTDQETANRARAVFVDYGGQPTIKETDGTPLTVDSVKLSSRHDALVLYLGRLIRMLWKSRVVQVGVGPTGGVSITSTISTSKLLAVQDNLEKLRTFLHANRAFIQGLSGPSDLQRVASKTEEVAVQAEHQALHALQKLMVNISEGISFVLMLFDERVSDIYTRLQDDATRQGLRDLTYEALFSTGPGKDLAKVLVKAIVNRNIESGSNVDTVADALRRRCGSFCSPDDVVIFKAQEQLKRASEQITNEAVARNLLQESLRLFQKVAGNLSYGNLQSAVEQYMKLRYFAGAIQLCLIVAREKDRGNVALAWVNDGRPPNDPRAAAYQDRRRCYDLVHQVLRQVDAVASAEPEFIDGRETLTATKRKEAYQVVNSSDDEVFHFGLYEWYIDQGWTDRLLNIESRHVITFLERLAQVDVAHAELLCRFYTHAGLFFKAAQVQLHLAESDFGIGIKDRITLLSRAKSNASVTTAEVSRQQQQLLNHKISDLLEVAHIQDDVLERLKKDARIDDQRMIEIETALDGKIQTLTELFNDYADQAGYYDLCLLIYHAADYRNPSTIAETWGSLIQQAHDEVATLPDGPDRPAPYESVSVKIQNIAHRTSCDAIIFPVQALLPELCAYAATHQQDATIGADPVWPVHLFLSVGVSHDIIVRVLEHVLDTQDNGFSGNRRVRLVELLLFSLDTWAKELRRRGGKSGAAMGPGIVELLEKCAALLQQPGLTNPGGKDVANMRTEARRLAREVAAQAERVQAGGSLRFA